jgi:hypothetical protein
LFHDRLLALTDIDVNKLFAWPAPKPAPHTLLRVTVPRVTLMR